jgi:hypothetical protein
MKARRVHLSNHCLALPGGTEDNDLWARVTRSEGGQVVVVSTWELTDAERAEIAAGANVELVIWGAGHPPVAVATNRDAIGRPPAAAIHDLRGALEAIGALLVDEPGGGFMPSHCGRRLAFDDVSATNEAPDRVWCPACGAEVSRIGVGADYVVTTPAEAPGKDGDR